MGKLDNLQLPTLPPAPTIQPNGRMSAISPSDALLVKMIMSGQQVPGSGPGTDNSQTRLPGTSMDLGGIHQNLSEDRPGADVALSYHQPPNTFWSAILAKQAAQKRDKK